MMRAALWSQRGNAVPSRSGILVCFGLALAFGAVAAHAANLKAFYSGSGMAPDGSSRVITLELAKDGTGTFQQHSGQGDIHKQLHWFRDGKTVTLELEPIPGKAPAPMTFKMERNSLVPMGTLDTQLGVFSFPVLHPFGPGDVGTSSGMSTCVNGGPGPCVMRETWNSNKSAQ